MLLLRRSSGERALEWMYTVGLYWSAQMGRVRLAELSRKIRVHVGPMLNSFWEENCFCLRNKCRGMNRKGGIMSRGICDGNVRVKEQLRGMEYRVSRWKVVDLEVTLQCPVEVTSQFLSRSSYFQSRHSKVSKLYTWIFRFVRSNDETGAVVYFEQEVFTRLIWRRNFLFIFIRIFLINLFQYRKFYIFLRIYQFFNEVHKIQLIFIRISWISFF